VIGAVARKVGGNASPVIASQLNSGHKVKLLIFPGPALPEFIQLIDFGPNRKNLELVHLPVSRGIKAFLEYFAWARTMDPALIWISPHAPRSTSSWKIPILLWSTKKLFWKKARLAGARSERLSMLFDESVSVDRSLPYMEREHFAFSMLSDSAGGASLRRISFIPRIQDQRKLPPLYDLLIHPGANAPSRMWPSSRYQELVRSLPPHLRIAVAGIPRDIEMMRLALPANRDIVFLTGSLEQAITAIARSRALLAMDSGAMHFAKVLNVPVVALFGKCDPATVIASGTNVLPIYERKFPCQPCGKPVCSQPEAYCINSIEAPTVAHSLLRLINQPSES
jgi:heptosyltransferase II